MLPSAAKQFAEKLGSSASGAKALAERKVFIAALEALRHPKSSFSADCKARVFLASTARLKPCPSRSQLASFHSRFLPFPLLNHAFAFPNAKSALGLRDIPKR